MLKFHCCEMGHGGSRSNEEKRRLTARSGVTTPAGIPVRSRTDGLMLSVEICDLMWNGGLVSKNCPPPVPS